LADFLDSSALKPFGKMSRNMVGSIYGRFSVAIAHFVSSFGSFGKAVSEKIFRNRPIKNKNYLWRPCLLTNRDKMSNLYREPSTDAFYQVSVHLTKRFQRRFLEIDQLEARIACGSHICSAFPLKPLGQMI
jgi:hypothetical protein